MKMICPHCGVKGSADDSLLGTKVKCPKCLGIFAVESEVIEPIAVDSMELEQLQDSPDSDLDVATNEEVDSVINELLGDTGDAPEEMIEDEAEIDRLLLGETEEEQDEVIAALSDMESDSDVEETQLEDVDETLTVIEDFPEEVLQDEIITPLEGDDVEQVLEKDKLAETDIEDELPLEGDRDLAAAEDVDDVESDEVVAAPSTDEIDIDDAFDFQDEKVEEEETVAASAHEIDIDDAFDIEDETVEAKQEEITETAEAEEEYLDLDEDTAAEEIELDDEETLASATETEADEVELDDTEDQEEAEEVIIDESHVIQKCSACGEYVDPDLKYEHESNVYCSKCLPPGAVRLEEPQPVDDEQTAVEVEEPETSAEGADQESEIIIDDLHDKEEDAEPAVTENDKEMLAAAASLQSDAQEADIAAAEPGKFTIATLIKDAYHYSKGAKSSIWAAIIVMSLILGGLWGGAAFLLYNYYSQGNTIAAGATEVGMQVVLNFFSYLFSAGILMIAVRRVAQEPFSWTMLFIGFKRFGSVLALYILMSIMLFIGFLLLILPGIYLTVGYMLALPLLFEKNLSPWQALERSRMAVHKRWWTVFFALIVLSILTALSAIPLGIGLIWTIPMFSILIAVLYYHFFGAED